jgi:hypothetical protein
VEQVQQVVVVVVVVEWPLEQPMEQEGAWK